MKNLKLFTLCFFALSMVFVSCKKDETPAPPVITAEDGWYISGDATSFTTLEVTNLFDATTNENDNNAARTGLYEKYVYLTAGKTFTISQVSGGVETKYGSADAKTFNPNGKSDQIKADVTWGTLVAGKTIAVAKTGLYQVAFDSKLKKFLVGEITHWGVIGGAALPGGWSSNEAMNLVGSLSPETNTYKVEGVTMIVGDFKFRYSDGWKIQLSDTITTAAMGKGADDVKVNTNFGGTVAAMVSGGGNIPNTVNGIYTLTMTWTKTTGKWTASVTKTGDYVPPTFPDVMYLVGDATAYGWTGPGDGTNNGNDEMHKVAGGGDNVGLYWKVLYIEGGKGFKVSAKGWADPNLGMKDNKGNSVDFDANGIAVSDNGGNMSIATSGMYTVVLDLRNNAQKISVTEAKVYGMGDAFGGWTADVAANLFTIQNAAKTMTSPALPVAGNIRMYVSHPWIAAWWNSEFNVYGTEIQYRNDGGDQVAVPGTAGKVITLHFDDNTGSIN